MIAEIEMWTKSIQRAQGSVHAFPNEKQKTIAEIYNSPDRLELVLLETGSLPGSKMEKKKKRSGFRVSCKRSDF